MGGGAPDETYSEWWVVSPSGQNDDELSCQQNDVVSVLEDLGDGWLRVRKGEAEGYVPETYVQMNA